MVDSGEVSPIVREVAETGCRGLSTIRDSDVVDGMG